MLAPDLWAAKAAADAGKRDGAGAPYLATGALRGFYLHEYDDMGGIAVGSEALYGALGVSPSAGSSDDSLRTAAAALARLALPTNATSSSSFVMTVAYTQTTGPMLTAYKACAVILTFIERYGGSVPGRVITWFLKPLVWLYEPATMNTTCFLNTS